MAITIESNISGQYVDESVTYCYLYEPFNIVVGEDTTANKISVNLVLRNTRTDVVEETILKYGEFDLAPNVKFPIDLMKMSRQYHNANIYKIGAIDDVLSESGKDTVLSNYVYEYEFYSNTDQLTFYKVRLLPIIGGRDFVSFTPKVFQSQKLTELVDLNLLGRYKDMPIFSNQLKVLTSLDKSPNISYSVDMTGENHPCGGILIWKSRLGGWCSWGMDYKSIKFRNRYSGGLSIGMFESTDLINGNPFIEADYTGVEFSKTINLKAFALSKEELKALSNISFSPAVYYTEGDLNKLELMRLTSVDTPINTFINGGDFKVGLSSISTQEFKTR